mgnify:CR=1 FL=1
MIYARVHDRTVQDDYYTAMAQIEQRLEIASPQDDQGSMGMGQQAQLLELASLLAAPVLSVEARLELVERLRRVLGDPVPEQAAPMTMNGRLQCPETLAAACSP